MAGDVAPAGADEEPVEVTEGTTLASFWKERGTFEAVLQRFVQNTQAVDPETGCRRPQGAANTDPAPVKLTPDLRPAELYPGARPNTAVTRLALTVMRRLSIATLPTSMPTISPCCVVASVVAVGGASAWAVAGRARLKLRRNALSSAAPRDASTRARVGDGARLRAELLRWVQGIGSAAAPRPASASRSI